MKWNLPRNTILADKFSSYLHSINSNHERDGWWVKFVCSSNLTLYFELFSGLRFNILRNRSRSLVFSYLSRCSLKLIVIRLLKSLTIDAHSNLNFRNNFKNCHGWAARVFRIHQSGVSWGIKGARSYRIHSFEEWTWRCVRWKGVSRKSVLVFVASAQEGR